MIRRFIGSNAEFLRASALSAAVLTIPCIPFVVMVIQR